ncbi:MAG: uracil-DNA glycosylase [Candidatus Westeberhardia cardiocondylae]|nr:uracil-DNA glycosylase [Candidatus Westeberhardia cardiocondylae]
MNNILTWRDVLSHEKKLLYFQKIFSFLNERYKLGVVIYPEKKNIFRALWLTDLMNVKIVIFGQDPYHNFNQADGLSFSVNPGVFPPPSLLNIYKELCRDIPDFVIPKYGCLSNWANQGVLLLNTILTVEHGKAYSHANLGWEIFTDKIVKILNVYRKGIIFLLWGLQAKKKEKIIDCNRHYILKSSHPSPFSVNKGFFGCRHFSKSNFLLQKQGIQPIHW